MIGDIIGGVGSILGGLLGSSAAKKDREMQLYLATHGVRLRAEDARAAGIHPLAALGASMPSYSPVGDGGLGAGLADAAAQFGSAADARTNKLDKDLEARAVEADIDLKSAQATALRAQAVTGITASKAITMGVETGAQNMQDTSGLSRNRAIATNNPELPHMKNLGDAAGLTTFPSGEKMETPNMEISPDAETDLYYHFRKGDLGNYIHDLIQKNSPTVSAIYEFARSLPITSPLRWAIEHADTRK